MPEPRNRHRAAVVSCPEIKRDRKKHLREGIEKESIT